MTETDEIKKLENRIYCMDQDLTQLNTEVEMYKKIIPILIKEIEAERENTQTYMNIAEEYRKDAKEK